jgi:serine/threonine protein kinase
MQQPAAMFKVVRADPPIPDNLSPEGKDFLQLCFRRNPAERPTASMLLEHPFIKGSFAGIGSPVSKPSPYSLSLSCS